MNEHKSTSAPCPYCGTLIWSMVRHCYRCSNYPRTTDALVARSDADALDALTRALER